MLHPLTLNTYTLPPAGLQQLRCLNLGWCHTIGSEDVAALAALTRLTALELARTRVSTGRCACRRNSIRVQTSNKAIEVAPWALVKRLRPTCWCHSKSGKDISVVTKRSNCRQRWRHAAG